MKEEIIRVLIKNDGEIDIETKNIVGKACVDEVQKLMKDIFVIQDMTLTPDYYKRDRQLRSDTRISSKGLK